MTLSNLKKELKSLGNPEKAKLMQRFFKTGPGEYGEGDVFIGLTVPEQRSVVKRYKDLSLKECEELLHDKIHEYRLVALLIMIQKYKGAEEDEKKKIFEIYLRNTLKMGIKRLVMHQVF